MAIENVENFEQGVTVLVINVENHSVKRSIEVTVSKTSVLVQHNFCKSKPVTSIKHEADFIVSVLVHMQVRIFGLLDKVIAGPGNRNNIRDMVFTAYCAAYVPHLFLDEKENLEDRFLDLKAVEVAVQNNFTKTIVKEKRYAVDGIVDDLYKMVMDDLVAAFATAQKISKLIFKKQAYKNQINRKENVRSIKEEVYSIPSFIHKVKKRKSDEPAIEMVVILTGQNDSLIQVNFAVSIRHVREEVDIIYH